MTTPVPPKSREGTPVPLEEAEQLLKIVDEQDRLDRQKFGISGDSYMMASSRLLMRKQLRQQNIDQKSKSPDIRKAKYSALLTMVGKVFIHYPLYLV